MASVARETRSAKRPRRRFSFRWPLIGLLLLIAGVSGFLGLQTDRDTAQQLEAQATASVPAGTVEVDGVRYRPIETYDVCDRVLGENPLLTDEQRAAFGPEPDPATWKLLRVLAPKVDGGTAKVKMVQPPEWLAEQQPEVGKTVPISVPECGIEGMAEVLSIGPCPPVKPGKGAVVLATFEHEVSSTVDFYVTGLAEPIGCTGNHPYWSEERQDFVRADELKPGELLSSFGPDAYVERIDVDANPKLVYNIEVQGEHVYRVTRGGLLVHNGGVCPLGKAGTGPLHHLVSKYDNLTRGWSQKWVVKSKQILDNARVSVESGWNKVYMPSHYGPHPELLHKRVYERLAAAVKGLRKNTKPYTEAVQKELRSIGQDLLDDVGKLNGPGLL